MTEIWIDAQLPPALAAWINRTYDAIKTQSAQPTGLRDAEDEEMFHAAREANVIMMNHDELGQRFFEPTRSARPASESDLGDMRKHIQPANANHS